MDPKKRGEIIGKEQATMVFCFENCPDLVWEKKSVLVKKLRVINQQENPKFRFRAQYLSYIQSLKFIYSLTIDPECN